MFLCLFSFLSKDFKGSEEGEVLVFFGGALLFRQKKKPRIGGPGKLLRRSIFGTAGSLKGKNGARQLVRWTPLSLLSGDSKRSRSKRGRPLVAPYCAIPRDYLSDTPLLRAMGFLVSQHGQLGAIPPPPFLSVSPMKSMRSGGAIPPPQKGYLSDTGAIL